MKHIIFLSVVGILSVIGCGHDAARIPTNNGRSKAISTTLDSESAVWNSSLFDGASMFAHSKHFDDYVHRAEVVATGILKEWDGTKGSVRLESVLHGKLNDVSVSLIATGGSARPKVDDRVLFLLSPRDGTLKLHSFCSASGLYNYSDGLAVLVKRSLDSAR